ncbi:LysR family transcriptional regulator [Nostoc sp.]|uniref:LysR family transcriptional regulator n=1 Tax=Nostoc sp. TaxID=1180 RepID=UPI002FF0E256
MDTLLSMKVFRQVVESGSFVAAAERLDLSTAMTSKHVMNLERNLGVRLLNRTSKHMSLTEIGTVYYEQCQEILERLEVVEAAVRRSAVAVHGVLKITAPVWFANPLFAKALAEYRSRYPDVLLDLNLNDRVVDLVEEGFDLGLRVTNNSSSSLLLHRICPIQFQLVGSPNYLLKHGYPTNLNELSNHLLLAYSYSQFDDGLVFHSGPNGREIVKMKVSMRSNSSSMLYQAALASMGLTFLPKWLIEEDLTSRQLEVLMPEYTFLTFLNAVYTSRRYLSPKVRTFVDFLTNYFSGIIEQENNG